MGAVQRYDAFGSLLPGRNYSSGSYRFGFNTQEKDDEIYGATGTSYTAEFWQYDPRTARRWNTDPVDKPWMSPYHAFSNKPIWNIDPNGANDHKYDVDDQGNVTLIERTDKEYDEVYFNDPEGCGTPLILNDQSIMPQLMKPDFITRNSPRTDPVLKHARTIERMQSTLSTPWPTTHALNGIFKALKGRIAQEPSS